MGRPRIKLQLTSFDKAMEILALAALLVLWVFSLVVIARLPDTVPVHFDFSGHPDRYGSKYELLILAAVGTGVYFLLTLLNRYPHVFNYTVTITKENAARQYALATRMLRVIKAIIMCILVMIIVFAYRDIHSQGKGLGIWFVPVMLVSILAPTIYYVTRSMRREK